MYEVPSDFSPTLFTIFPNILYARIEMLWMLVDQVWVQLKKITDTELIFG